MGTPGKACFTICSTCVAEHTLISFGPLLISSASSISAFTASCANSTAESPVRPVSTIGSTNSPGALNSNEGAPPEIVAEWSSQFLGDRAYKISEAEKRNVRWEAAQFRAGKLWHRWDYPNEVGSTRFEERYPVFSKYITDNWRSFRGWGVSAISPWEHGHFWKLREGVKKERVELPLDWENLQRPGFSPDYTGEGYERMDLAYERSDWAPTA